MKKIIYAIAVMVAMVACSKGQKAETEAEESQALSIEEQYPGLELSAALKGRLELQDTVVQIPEEYTAEEKIVYLENKLIVSPMTMEELLSLAPVHTLDPDTARYGDAWKPEYWTEEGREKTALVNRFMRMHFVSMGDPLDELQWAMAVDTMLGEYAAAKHISKEKALEGLSEGVGHLEAGTQYEINLWCYIEASIAYYKTLHTYCEVIENQFEADKQELLYYEYQAWVRMNNARQEAYINIRRAGDHYSALPMEFEGMYAAFADYRTQLLKMENEILWLDRTYKRKHPIMGESDWNEYLDHKLFRLAADEDSTIINELDQAVREWLKMRQRVAKSAYSAAQESYENLTSDYYWVIIHEAEPMPEGYY